MNVSQSAQTAKFNAGDKVLLKIPGTRDRVPATVERVTRVEERQREGISGGGGGGKWLYEIRWPGGMIETLVPELRLVAAYEARCGGDGGGK